MTSAAGAEWLRAYTSEMVAVEQKKMTSAAGAEWLCAYTSEMVAVDISIDADSDISLNYNLVEKDETNN